jgi:tetratricopeptide (TPR) repeat protein
MECSEAEPSVEMASPAVLDECFCIICLESDPLPIQSGCGCRSDSGLAHVTCLVEKAVSQQPHRGYAVWTDCQTCKQEFTGAMKTGLAEAWWLRMCDQAEECLERLRAAVNLASSRFQEGKYPEAVRIAREVLAVQRRVLGDEHPEALTTAHELALSLTRQGKYVDAERINREVLDARRRVLGNEHPGTLATGSNLALALSSQGKHIAAERICRQVRTVMHALIP